jgi:hypothetical protein
LTANRIAASRITVDAGGVAIPPKDLLGTVTPQRVASATVCNILNRIIAWRRFEEVTRLEA